MRMISRKVLRVFLSWLAYPTVRESFEVFNEVAMGVNDADAAAFENILHYQILKELALADTRAAHDIEVGIAIAVRNLGHLILVLVLGEEPAQVERIGYLFVV